MKVRVTIPCTVILYYNKHTKLMIIIANYKVWTKSLLIIINSHHVFFCQLFQLCSYVSGYLMSYSLLAVSPHMAADQGGSWPANCHNNSLNVVKFRSNIIHDNQ